MCQRSGMSPDARRVVWEGLAKYERRSEAFEELAGSWPLDSARSRSRAVIFAARIRVRAARAQTRRSRSERDLEVGRDELGLATDRRTSTEVESGKAIVACATVQQRPLNESPSVT